MAQVRAHIGQAALRVHPERRRLATGKALRIAAEVIAHLRQRMAPIHWQPAHTVDLPSLPFISPPNERGWPGKE